MKNAASLSRISIGNLSNSVKIIGSENDCRQPLPITYPSVRTRFLNSRSNFWTPQTISMNNDLNIWNGNYLTEDDIWVFKTNISYLTAGDNLVPDNIANAIIPYITANEMRQFLRWQIAEEANHIESYLFILESLGIDDLGRGRIFELYNSLPDLVEKLNWNIESSLNISSLTDADIKSEGSLKALVENLTSYLCFEFIFFPCGFSQIFALARQGKFINTAEQYSYIWRDENNHSANAIWLINQILKENKWINTQDLKDRLRDLIAYAVELEYKHSNLIFQGGGIIGYPKADYNNYAKFLANLLWESIGGENRLFKITEHPIPWISEFEINAEVNFFEGRVKEYQTGSGLDWSNI